MSSTVFLSFGTYAKEIDVSQIPSFISSVQGGIVGETPRGTMKLSMYSSVDRFEALTGKPNPKISYVGDTANAFFTQANQLWHQRVVNGALYSNLTYFRDVSVSPHLYYNSRYNPKKLSLTKKNYSVATNFSAGDQLTVAVTDGVANFNATTTVAVSHAGMMASLVNTINTLLLNYTSNGLAILLAGTSGKTFAVHAPSTKTLTWTFTTAAGAPPVVTLGTTDTTTSLLDENDPIISTIPEAGYESPDYWDRSFEAFKTSADFVTGNSIAITVSDGEFSYSASVGYQTNNDVTLRSAANAINLLMGYFASTATGEGSAGYAGMLPTASGHSRTLFVYSPVGRPVIVTMTVTGGASQPTVTEMSNPRIMDLVAENPGSWATMGSRVYNVNTGVPTRWKLTSNAAFVTGNSISVVIEENEVQTTVGPIAFTSDSDTTLNAIVTAVVAAYPALSGTVTAVSGGADNDREIVFNGAATPSSFKIVGATVTGGAVQPTLSALLVNTGIESDYSFTLGIFEKQLPTIPVESWRVSLSKRTDGFGRQMFVENIVNESGEQSDNVRVHVNPTLVDSNFFWYGTTVSATNNYVDDTPRWMRGGNDGMSVTSAQIIAGWGAFKKRNRIPARLFLNAGYTDPSVQQKMVALAEYRGDSFAILDMPSDRQKAQSAYNYRMFDLNINSSYGSINTPDLKIKDSNDVIRFVPPSGHVGAVFAYTAREAKFFSAPAGLRRGLIRGVISLREDYEPGDTDLLHPNGINTILDRSGIGPVLFAEETLQIRKSVLSSVHTRLLTNTLKMAFLDGLDYTNFEPNNEATRYEVVQLGHQILKPVFDDGGVEDYFIKCDAENNDAMVRNRDTLVVGVYYAPIHVNKYVVLNMILTDAGASFEELIANRVGF